MPFASARLPYSERRDRAGRMGQLLRQLRQLDLRILTQRMLTEPVLLNLGFAQIARRLKY